MAIVWQNTFDGDHFVAITPANSSDYGDPVTSVGGTVTYSTDWAAHGTAAALVGAGDGATDGSIDVEIVSTPDWSVRWYSWVPSDGWQQVTVFAGDWADLSLIDGDQGDYSILGQDVTSQAAHLVGQPVRIEASKVGSTVTVRVWWTDPDSTGVHDLQVQATNTSPLTYLEIRGGGFGTPPSWIDEIAIAQGEWIGPAVDPIDETGAGIGEMVLFGEAGGYPSWSGAAEGTMVLYGQADGRAQGLAPAEGWFELWGEADGWPGHIGGAHGDIILFGEASGIAATGSGATGNLVLFGEADGFAGASVATGRPVRDMWLGPLGLLHRMRQRAEWERVPELGVERHVSLHGTVTVSRARRAPRSTQLTWSQLDRHDADALEEMTLVPARADATIAVVDPDAAAGNLLTPEQSRGRPGPGSGPVAVEHLYQITGPGTVAVGLVNGVRYTVVDGAEPGTDIRWLHPYYGVRGWPVMPGWPVYMAAALANQALAPIGRVWLTFYDHAGVVLSSAAGLVGDGQCQADAPEGAATVSPHVIVSEDAPGLRLLGEARMSYAPQSVEARPLGNGAPVYSVAGYTDTPALPWRTTSLELQEVRTHAYR